MTLPIASNPSSWQKANQRDSFKGLSTEPIIKLKDVAVRYRVPQERIPTFKEYAIRWLRGQVRYNSFWALQNINLEVMPGEVFGIVGPNGAGKSTLLKVIARVLYPTRGQVQITGRVAPLLELGAGFDSELTGRENIYLNGAILGYTKAQIDAMFPEIVEFSGLQDFIEAPLRTYSTGMFARLGFSVATASRPDILIVDEILGVGDAEFQTKSFERIQSFKADGTTILLVSHSLERVEELCARVMWLEHGEILSIGDATPVLSKYVRNSMEKESKRLIADRQSSDQASSAQVLTETASSQVPATELPNSTPEANHPDTPLTRWGSRLIEITHVRLTDPSGNEQVVFETGQPFRLQLDYLAHRPISGAIFGMAIHRHDGVHITGPNSSQTGLVLPEISGKGTIIYQVGCLQLLEGLYYISVAVVNDEDSEIFDYHDRQYPFRVMNVKHGPEAERIERYGLMTLGGKWIFPNN